MAKFYVGQKVTVTVNHPEDSLLKIGDIVKVTKFIGEDNIGENYQLDGFWDIHGEYLSPITETPETLTINGVEYVRKPEPAHEWKFGDVVENEGKRYMLIKEYGLEDHVSNGANARHLKVVDFETKNVKSIQKAHTKFLRRTDFSV